MIQHICPFSKSDLVYQADALVNETIQYPKIKGAYRVLQSDENYTESFGFQWNKFVKTQVDQASNLEISKKRFFAETNWNKEDLTNKNVLEVGSGAGRFTQVILDYTNANLYSVDYSNAVEANYKNNGHHDRLFLYQASIYELPFAANQFDKVICIGVLQHTPDFEKSIASLIGMVKPGGELIVDFYPIRGFWTKIHAKYIFRPFTKKMSHERLLKLIDKNIDWMIATTQFFNRIGVGRFLNRFIPIVDIAGTLPKELTPKQLREWCVLDTFDMFSPAFDQPQKIATVKTWFEKYGMKNVWAGDVTYDNAVAAVVKGNAPS